MPRSATLALALLAGLATSGASVLAGSEDAPSTERNPLVGTTGSPVMPGPAFTPSPATPPAPGGAVITVNQRSLARQVRQPLRSSVVDLEELARQPRLRPGMERRMPGVPGAIDLSNSVRALPAGTVPVTAAINLPDKPRERPVGYSVKPEAPEVFAPSAAAIPETSATSAVVEPAPVEPVVPNFKFPAGVTPAAVAADERAAEPRVATTAPTPSVPAPMVTPFVPEPVVVKPEPVEPAPVVVVPEVKVTAAPAPVEVFVPVVVEPVVSVASPAPGVNPAESSIARLLPPTSVSAPTGVIGAMPVPGSVPVASTALTNPVEVPVETPEPAPVVKAASAPEPTALTGIETKAAAVAPVEQPAPEVIAAVEPAVRVEAPVSVPEPAARVDVGALPSTMPSTLPTPTTIVVAPATEPTPMVVNTPPVTPEVVVPVAVWPAEPVVEPAPSVPASDTSAVGALNSSITKAVNNAANALKTPAVQAAPATSVPEAVSPGVPAAVAAVNPPSEPAEPELSKLPLPTAMPVVRKGTEVLPAPAAGSALDPFTAKSDAVVLRVQELTGTPGMVQWLKEGAADWQIPELNDNGSGKYTIRTGPDAGCTITVDQSTRLRIGRLSRAELRSMASPERSEQRRIVVSLTRGRVAVIPAPGQAVNVYTPQSLVVVREPTEVIHDTASGTRTLAYVEKSPASAEVLTTP